jgi:hypothetical protein
VFADPMARALLSRAGDEPEAVDLGAGVVVSWNGRIAICEGEPDYLTAAADIDRALRIASQDFPPEVKYVDYHVCTPREEFTEMVRKRSNPTTSLQVGSPATQCAVHGQYRLLDVAFADTQAHWKHRH